MIGIIDNLLNGGAKVEPKKVPVSLFTRDEAFGVDSIAFDLLVDESHTLEFEASDHPIEDGSVITDHVTQKLRTCTVTGMFSNTPNVSSIEADENDWEKYRDSEVVYDGQETQTNRSRDLFEKLDELACERRPVRLVTAMRVYPEMIITSLPVKRDSKDGESVKFTITLREFKTAQLKKTAVFGRFRAPDMKTAENRIIATKSTNGKVSAKEKELADAAVSGVIAR